jgi:hypothetical protein
MSIVLYHSGPTFGQVLDAFVVDVSDYSGHLIRHHLNASEVFPMEWFLQFWEQVKVWWAQPTRLWTRTDVKQLCIGLGLVFILMEEGKCPSSYQKIW